MFSGKQDQTGILLVGYKFGCLFVSCDIGMRFYAPRIDIPPGKCGQKHECNPPYICIPHNGLTHRHASQQYQRR
jgi:hypothetical protein